jgi:hypothetical protein
MDKVFFSKNNFNILKNVIQKVINDEYNINVNEHFNQDIFMTMDYVGSNVSNDPPQGYSMNKYIELMNKKVLNLCLPKIKENINNNVIESEQNNTNNNRTNIQDYTFDNSGNSNNEFDPVLEPPQMTSHAGDLEDDYSQMHSMREDHIPQDMNPQNNTQIIEKGFNSQDKYNKIIEDRGLSNIPKPRSQINEFFEQSNNLTNTHNQETILVKNNDNLSKSIEQFENINKEMNDKMDKKVKNIDTNIATNNNIDKLIVNNEIRPVKEDFNISIANKRNDSVIINNKEVYNQHEIFRKKDEETLKQLDIINESRNKIDSSYPVIMPPKNKLKKKNYFVTIDSINRDLVKYPNCNNFKINFAPTSDDYDHKIITDGTIRPKTMSLEEYFKKHVLLEGKIKISGNSDGAYISRTFDNVRSVECVQVIVPNTKVYVGGNKPSRYNTSTKEFNKDFRSGRFGPVYDDCMGIGKSILDEPYVLLKIDELESPYYGTNIANSTSFAKLVYDGDFGRLESFLKLRTADHDEIYEYDPTTLGKLNSFTLSLRKFNNILYNFGQDKIHVESIKGPFLTVTCDEEKDEEKKECNDDVKCCNVKRYYFKISISCMHEDYKKSCCDNGISGNIINGSGHGIKPGDLIYLFNTNICSLENRIKFNLDKIDLEINNIDNSSNKSTFKLKIITLLNKDIENSEDNLWIADYIDFNQINFKTSNIIEFIFKNGSKSQYTIIEFINNKEIKLEYKEGIEIDESIDIEDIKYLNYYVKKLNGILNEDPHSLNYKGGINVISICDNKSFIVETYGENSQLNIESYFKNDMFFIQHNKQLSYTFKITTLEKNTEILDSRLN